MAARKSSGAVASMRESGSVPPPWLGSSPSSWRATGPMQMQPSSSTTIKSSSPPYKTQTGMSTRSPMTAFGAKTGTDRVQISTGTGRRNGAVEARLIRALTQAVGPPRRERPRPSGGGWRVRVQSFSASISTPMAT
eukprot:Lithocolla_globosa_v1_NODE_4715_length_1381_cov_116.150075.p2 type:complete len:136 gc:universal NODE_4715_length_1381_cov_116.150075:509-916(+)